jgi:glycosyltransferase involved in cell wall biosynthesis
MQKGFADLYLSKYTCDFFIAPETFMPFDLAIVVPCYNEPEIGQTIHSLFKSDSEGIETAVVVVVNSTTNSPQTVIDQNQNTVSELNLLAKESVAGKQLFVLDAGSFPSKHGGVGWARKIGMDWAVAQYNHFGCNEGIIVSLDADSLVEKNYLAAICSYFNANPKKIAATIFFEHHFSISCQLAEIEGQAVIMYELYMRYYRNALLQTGFPHAMYTVGSCFAVKADAYIAQGGMNRRKAGEDFYFLHKLSMLGEIGEINTTTVYPSARMSDRVPFGTGPAIRNYCEGDRSIETTYPLEAFLKLKPFFARVPEFYALGREITDEDLSSDHTFLLFVKDKNLTSEIQELKVNCSNSTIFKKRFHHLFNAFMVLKWLNFSAVNSCPKQDLVIESGKLLSLFGVEMDKIPEDPKLLLNLYRQIDRDKTNI